MGMNSCLVTAFPYTQHLNIYKENICISVSNVLYITLTELEIHRSEKEISFSKRDCLNGLLTLSSLSCVICSGVRVVDNLTKLIRFRNRLWDWQWKLFWHSDVEILRSNRVKNMKWNRLFKYWMEQIWNNEYQQVITKVFLLLQVKWAS